MPLYSVRNIRLNILVKLKYWFIKFNYVNLTRISHHTLGAKKCSRDYRFSLDTVGCIKYTYETVFCKKNTDVLFGKIFYISWSAYFRILYWSPYKNASSNYCGFVIIIRTMWCFLVKYPLISVENLFLSKPLCLR